MKKLLHKILGLVDLDEFIKKTEKRILNLEHSADITDDKIADLENSDILNYDVEDITNYKDYEAKIDDLESRICDIEGHEILDYESDNFVYFEDFEEYKKETELKIDRLTKALQKLASQSNIELRIDEILEGAEDE